MNRKHNPLVSLVALLLALLLVIICAGCGAREDSRPSARFTIEHHAMDGSVMGCYVITDAETGAQYLAYKTTYGLGLTAMQGGEG